ncbi:MAG: EAL domain-containing protein, partial [Acidimicrobiia bacterium]|nr:EAL domain-containing protein [Acidimicrobiia bacterium]MDH4364447.1 EAL domain-containing protein [Acidimicrobiia bacterium]MDH5291960.1 EAL domain-containing protein [Acidimicrobiia bacterium]
MDDGAVTVVPAAAAVVALAILAAGISGRVPDLATWLAITAIVHRTGTVDELKVDRSFVAAVDRDRKAQAVVGATVELGRTLALEVVAEVVETQEELAEVTRRGFDVTQGYLLSRPLPGDELARFLATRTLERTDSETS